MATQVQWRGGSTAEHSTFTGAAREVTVDTQKKTLVVHDGSTAGGEPLLREDQANLPSSVTNGLSVPSANSVALSTNGTGRLFVSANGVGVGSQEIAGYGTLQVRNGFVYVNEDGANTKQVYIRSDEPAIQVASNDPFKILTNNQERLRITSAGLVGIGTSSPSEALDVIGRVRSQWDVYANGGGTSYAGDAASLVSGATAGMWAARSDSALLFSIGTSEKVRIDSSGRVGIGATSPESELHVSSSGPPKFILQRTGATNPAKWSISAGDNKLLFKDEAANAERMRIDDSGRLLVGTSSWTADDVFVVEANAVSGNNYALMALARGGLPGSSSSSLGFLRFTDNSGNVGAEITASADGAWTSGSNHLSRLVFSTTADGESSPTERMRISNDGRTEQWSSNVVAFGTSSSQAADSSNYLYVGRYGATNNAGGTTSFFIYTSGDVRNTNNSYGAISDIKLKENIVDANSQWDDIKALQVRNYNFKEGQTHTQIGLIAQEVELVSPGLVSESPDRDEDGNDLGTVTKSVNYSVLYMKAVKALQEAMERIETLEQRLNDAGIN